jgi:hypothetical protein
VVVSLVVTASALAQDAETPDKETPVEEKPVKEKPLPKFETAANSVRREFAALTYYKQGDIISHSEVKQAFDHLRLLGWTVPDANEILAKIPGDKEFLVRQMRTEKGFKFMRSVSQWPESYDRLDRLTALPDGRRILLDLIDDRGGYEMVDYLVNSDGGGAMGQMLTQAPGGADFKKPTGKIYTVDQLLDRLERSYEKTLELRKKQAEEADASGDEGA